MTILAGVAALEAAMAEVVVLLEDATFMGAVLFDAGAAATLK